MIDYVTQCANRGRWPEDIKLWRIALPSSDHAVDKGVLSASERQRVDRYHRTEDRVRFAVTRSVLRHLLGYQLGMHAQAVALAEGAYGRPVLGAPHAALSFNVSHARGYALIAMSNARAVGVDLEWCDPSLAWQGLVSLTCTGPEQAALLRSSQSPAWKRDRFLRCWTAKEALLKALGHGITEGLLSITLDLVGDSATATPIRADPPYGGVSALRYCWLGDTPGYVACLAYGKASTSSDIM